MLHYCLKPLPLQGLQIFKAHCVAFQGGLDGGLNIPHGVKRFVGYDTEGKKLDTEQLQKYILGGHVSRLHIYAKHRAVSAVFWHIIDACAHTFPACNSPPC